MSPIERYLPPLSESAARWVRFFAVVAGVVLLGWLCVALSDVLTPIVAGFAIAYILNPAVTWLEVRRGVRRITSVTAGMAILLVATGVLTFAGVVQVIEFVGNVPGYVTATDRWLRDTVPILFSDSPAAQDAARGDAAALYDRAGVVAGSIGPAPADSAPDAISDETSDTHPATGRVLKPTVRTWLQDIAINAAKASPVYVNGMLALLFYWGSVVVLVPMYAFFFLLHFNTLIATIRDHLPDRYRETIVRIATTIDQSISNFFRGRLIVCLLVGTCTAIGWTIVRVPSSLPLGAMAGLLNLIPFMSILALPPALILTYAKATDTGDNWVWPVVMAMAVYMAVQALESFVLSPIVESRASGLHPVTTVVVLLIGNQVAGLLGMLLAIPIASTLKSLGIEYALPELRRLAEASAAGRPPPDLPGAEVAKPVPADSAPTEVAPPETGTDKPH